MSFIVLFISKIEFVAETFSLQKEFAVMIESTFDNLFKTWILTQYI